MERLDLHIIALQFRTALLTCFTAADEYSNETTVDSSQFIMSSKPVTNFDLKVTKKHLNALQSETFCTDPHTSLTNVTTDDGYVRLIFSVLVHDRETIHSLVCTIRLTSQPSHAISAVLLDHCPCSGGVSVLLRDGTRGKRRRRWDVCSSWRVPGPDFTTTSGMVEMEVEWSDVADPCEFSVRVMAVEKPQARELELRYLSDTEGMFCWGFLLFFVVVVFVFFGLFVCFVLFFVCLFVCLFVCFCFCFLLLFFY